MVTAEDFAARKAAVAGSADLQALLRHLRTRAQPVIERMPHVPEQKALLSSNGGSCPDDGAALTFDPWSPTEHRCPRCGKTWHGERHDRHWARFQHLWLAERAVHLATVAAFGTKDDCAAANRAREILAIYGERYWRYPNRDNLLGPSRLFFSTYLESIWTCSYLAAAMMLRAADLLDENTTKLVNQLTEEAATLIGDYDEGFSNRQTWNNAALTAVAVWFEDEELAQRTIEGDTGLLAHLVRGYGRDGLWYEGENYHLFALRGLLTGATWARLAGFDFWSDEHLAARLIAALRAPTLTALPDFTYPARKDARFGVSLAQPAFVELWEVGLGNAGHAPEGEGEPDFAAWLSALYRVPRPVPELLESYLHDFGEAPSSAGARASLSWWSLLEMLPELPAGEEAWHPRSALIEGQGLAVLRRGERYVSLEAGSSPSGHGHADQLHLTLYADGMHWLPDPGTGSYVTRDLFWYRSILAHNAPRLDGTLLAETRCECYAEQGDWGWVRGRAGNLSRAIVAGPAYIVDVVELSSREDHLLELFWHIAGRGDVETKGRWVEDEIAGEFVTRVQRFVPDAPAPVVIQHTGDGARLTAHVVLEGELLQAEGPPLPGGTERAPFYVARARGRNVRIVTVIESYTDHATVHTVRTRGEVIEIETATGIDRHRPGNLEWTIESAGARAAPQVLRGARESAPPFKPVLEIDAPAPVAAPAFRVAAPPPLDGTLEGFEITEPLQLVLEDQYRRSEDAYPGPDDFSALGYAGWDERFLYLAVDVTKPDLILRAPDAAPLLLDNEPDDIHSDGLQVYVVPAHSAKDVGEPVGYLIVPQDPRGVRVSATSDTPGAVDTAAVRGAWRPTEHGYCVTVAIPWPEGSYPHAGARLGFDLIVNEMLPGRVRRSGQLVWSGGNGWVWLRGDRQDPARFGVLELVG